MTFEEWFEQNGDKTPFDDKELGAAWELIKYFWEAGRNSASNEDMWIYGD